MTRIERQEMTRAHEARKAQRQADKEAYNKKQDNVKMQEDKAIEKGVNKAKAKGRNVKNRAKKALTPEHYDTKQGDRNKMGLGEDLKDRARVTINETANDVKDAGYKAARKGYHVLKNIGNNILNGGKAIGNAATSAKAYVKKKVNNVKTYVAQKYDDVKTGAKKAWNKGTSFLKNVGGFFARAWKDA